MKKESNDTRDVLIQSLRAEVEDLKARNRALTQEVQALRIRAKSSAGNLFAAYNGNLNSYN